MCVSCFHSNKLVEETFLSSSARPVFSWVGSLRASLFATMLQYDNSAFYYFMITVLTFYLIPTGYWLVRRVVTQIYRRINKDIDVSKARTEVERKKFIDLYEKKRAWSHLFTIGFLVNLTFFFCAAYLFTILFEAVSSDSEIAQFDPFAILGIESGAAAQQIKRAYRKQSLMFHPDKNPGNKLAAEKFLKIAKVSLLNDEPRTMQRAPFVCHLLACPLLAVYMY